jgi:DNA-binding winged helix-turn-helix (wHTH) protein
VIRNTFRIGNWLVEPDQNRLVRGEHEAKIDTKAMGVLVCLVEHADDVVLKEHIFEAVWEDTFVTDEVLTNAVWELRRALGADAKSPSYIQTVPRKGYRVIAPVSRQVIRQRRVVEVPIDKTPYPGLSPFSEEDAEFFYGREEEVEAVWKKLRNLYLLAIIGPSGAGKTSFLSAGLSPSRPEGWRIVFCHPTDNPFASLGQALVPELSVGGAQPAASVKTIKKRIALVLLVTTKGDNFLPPGSPGYQRVGFWPTAR